MGRGDRVARVSRNNRFVLKSALALLVTTCFTDNRRRPSAALFFRVFAFASRSQINVLRLHLSSRGSRPAHPLPHRLDGSVH